jgi:hypothetical protein
VPPLLREDAQTSLYFFLVGIQTSVSPVDDPVFSAHHGVSIAGHENETFYRADQMAGVLACTEQVRMTTSLVHKQVSD